MPTKELTKEFIRKHKEIIKVKLSGHTTLEINKLVETAVEALSKDHERIKAEWNELKMKYDKEEEKPQTPRKIGDISFRGERGEIRRESEYEQMLKMSKISAELHTIHQYGE